ncbi:MAG: methionyl-tRNA formyltransferase [Patescibacteria group bacterium]
MKFAFFGTPDLVIPILDELEKNNLLPSVIITGMDREKGRGLEIQSPAPKAWGMQRNIPVLQPEKIDEAFVENFKKNNFDIGVVVAYGKILPQALIDSPAHGMINVHYSLLPKYRGATPVESAVLNADKETGVCIQQMVFALDAGDVIAEEKATIDPDEKAIDLRVRLNEIAKIMLPKAMIEVCGSRTTSKKQDDSLATYCKKIKKENGLLDLSADGLTNYNKFRAYFGHVGTYFFVEKNGKQIRVKITDAKFENGEFKILKVIPEGKKEMAYEDFKRGR